MTGDRVHGGGEHIMGRLRWMVVALLSAAAFGMSGTFVKPLFEAGWSPGAGSIVRTGVAGLVLAVPAARTLRGRWWLLRRHWLALLAFGGVGIAGTQIAYFTAVDRIPVGTALMIEYLAPVLLVLATAIRLRRPPQVPVLIGSVLAMTGLALVLDLGSGGALDPIGLAAALVAAVVCAVYFQLSATIPVPPLALAAVGFWIATAASALLGVIGLVPVTIGAPEVRLLGAAVPALVPLAVVVLVATVLAYALEVTAASRIGARATSFLALTEVLFASVAAAIVLGQVPGPMQLVGGLSLVAGVLLVVSAPTRHRPPLSVDVDAEAAATSAWLARRPLDVAPPRARPARAVRTGPARAPR
jgi:drug/metabolite transporter (DMT)-like permease